MPHSAPAFAQNDRPWILVVMGVSGCGKTTVGRLLAAHYGVGFVDADDLHSPEARAQMSGGEPLTDEQRAPWLERVADLLIGRAEAGQSTILAFSGLRRAHRQRLRELGLPVGFVFLAPDPAIVANHLRRRTDHFMPPSLLDSQFHTLEAPREEPDIVTLGYDLPAAQLAERTVAALRSEAAVAQH